MTIMYNKPMIRAAITTSLTSQITSLGVLGILLFSGCSTNKKYAEKKASPTFDRMTDPSISVEPVSPSEPARVARISQDPVPVYRSPKVREIKMDAYVNERGEAFPPSVKYVVADPGGWNLEALRNPSVSYVPPENSLDIPSSGSHYTRMTQSSSGSAPSPSRFLYDLKDVKVTGFTELGQEARARSMASSSDTAIFDSNLGWILVPKSAIRESSPGAKQRAVIPQKKYEATAELNAGGTGAPKSDFDLMKTTPRNVAPPIPMPSTRAIPPKLKPKPTPKPNVAPSSGSLDGSLD